MIKTKTFLNGYKDIFICMDDGKLLNYKFEVDDQDYFKRFRC